MPFLQRAPVRLLLPPPPPGDMAGPGPDGPAFGPDGEPLVVQTDGENSANIGDNLSLSFDLNKCHLFDQNNLAFK